MSAAALNWRSQLLERAQKNFEQYVIGQSLMELTRIEQQLRMEAAKAGAMGGKAAAAELEKVGAMRKKLQSLQDLGRANLRKQVSGMAGMQLDQMANSLKLVTGPMPRKM